MWHPIMGKKIPHNKSGWERGHGRGRGYEYGRVWGWDGSLNNSYPHQKWDKDVNKQEQDKKDTWPMYVTSMEKKGIGLLKQVEFIIEFTR